MTGMVIKPQKATDIVGRGGHVRWLRGLRYEVFMVGHVLMDVTAGAGGTEK